jgi:hypothetical protein
MVATPGVLAYTTSKHAALGLTKNSGEYPCISYHLPILNFPVVSSTGMLTCRILAALDNAAYGIRVNCVCPSWVDTPMVRQAIEGVEGLGRLIDGAVPIGRIATTEEIADTVVFLCSPRSSYITGCGLIIDGGATLCSLR